MKKTTEAETKPQHSPLAVDMSNPLDMTQSAHEALVEAAKVALMELEAIVRDGGLGGPSCGNKNMDSHQALLSAQGRAETRNLLRSAIAKAQGDA